MPEQFKWSVFEIVTGLCIAHHRPRVICRDTLSFQIQSGENESNMLPQPELRPLEAERTLHNL